MNKKPTESLAWLPPNLTPTQRESALRWASRRISKGLPVGCYGIYKHIASENSIRKICAKVASERRIKFAETYGDRKDYNAWRMWCLRNKIRIQFSEWKACPKEHRRERLVKPHRALEAKAAIKIKKESARSEKISELVKANILKFKSKGLI